VRALTIAGQEDLDSPVMKSMPRDRAKLSATWSAQDLDFLMIVLSHPLYCGVNATQALHLVADHFIQRSVPAMSAIQTSVRADGRAESAGVTLS
jgi:hypothetical protein